MVVRVRPSSAFGSGAPHPPSAPLMPARRARGGRGAHPTVPKFKTDNTLGDYTRIFENFHTETDVKTKIMILSSNPKAYNLDKLLEFLATERSVFMFYFVGVDPGRIVNTALISIFQTRLLAATIMLKHWAGRNSRGVTQFDGRVVGELIESPEFEIDVDESVAFLNRVIGL